MSHNSLRSSPLAVRWAARHPGTVGNLVLYGGWVSGDRIATPKLREHVRGLVEQHRGPGSDVLTDIFAPEAGLPGRRPRADDGHFIARHDRAVPIAAWLLTTTA
jgi:hypothetical protein